jgi:signal transduction histidine kinase
MRERVFAPFETTKPNGTGLGLSLVRHIVDSYGGEIRISGSELGGARVWLWLPCERKREQRKGK